MWHVRPGAERRIVETGHDHRLRVDRILHLPGVAGPRIAGLPCDPDGFIPVGADLHVDDDPDVLAIGDGAVGAYKHGGLAALQADAVAQELAARAGALLAPQPYRPALQAVLATNDGPRYLRAEPPGRRRRERLSAECLWWPPTKVASHWLAPWLATLDPRRPTTRRRRADRGRREADAVEPRRGHARRHP